MTSDHVFLKASTDFLVLTENTVACLRQLNFEFFQNKGRDLIEYEITKPAYFRVLVEKRKDPEVGNLLIPSIKTAKGSTIDIWFDEEESRGSKDYAKQFANSLLPALPDKPWEGLKFRESGKEKKKWLEFSSFNT
jgi:hypothetical protein